MIIQIKDEIYIDIDIDIIMIPDVFIYIIKYKIQNFSFLEKN